MRATRKMPANGKKNGGLPGRKDHMDCSSNLSSALRPAFVMDKTPMCPNTTQTAQQRHQLAGTFGHAPLVLHARTPSVNTPLPSCGQGVASVAREPHHTGDSYSSQMGITQAPADLASLSKDGAPANAKGSPKPCSGSRARRREHVKERKALACPKGPKAPEGNTSCHAESMVICHEQEKANDSTSPASTTSEERRDFGSQGKDAADTAFASALNLQQASRSSTSATPPASDCSSDESPSSSPGITEDAAVDSERPFEPAVTNPTNCVSDTDGEPKHMGESSTKPSDKNGKVGTRNDSRRRASRTATSKMSSNAITSGVACWPFAPEQNKDEERSLATQDGQQDVIETRFGKPPSAGRANLDIHLRHQPSSTQTAVACNDAAADHGSTLTAGAGLSTVHGISSTSSGQNHAQHPSSSAPQHSAPPSSSLLPRMHDAKPWVPPLASCENFLRDVEGGTDTLASPTASEWRFPLPKNLREEAATLQGPHMQEDTGVEELQENGTPMQKQCAKQLEEHIGRMPASCTDDLVQKDAVIRQTNEVGGKVGVRVPERQGPVQAEGKTAALLLEEQGCSWNKPLQNIKPATFFGIMPRSSVVENTSIRANADKVLNRATPTLDNQRPPPSVLRPHLSSSPPLPHQFRSAATDSPCLSGDRDMYYKALNHFTTTLGSCTKVEGTQLPQAKSAHLPSDPVQQPQGHGQHEQQLGFTAKLTQGVGGGVETPRGGREKNRCGEARTHPCSVPDEGGAEVTVEPRNRHPSATLSPLLAAPTSLSGSAVQAGGEERREQCVALVESLPYNPRTESFWSGSSVNLPDSSVTPLHQPPSPASTRTAVVIDANVSPSCFHDGSLKGGEVQGFEGSGCSQWYSASPNPHDRSSIAAPEGISEERTRLDPDSRTSVSLPILQGNPQQQARQEATTAAFDQLTVNGPQGCTSYCCAPSPLTSLWAATTSPSTNSRSFCDSSDIGGGDATASRSTEVTRKNYASMCQEKQVDPQHLDRHMPARQQQERPQQNNRPLEERDVTGEKHSRYAAVANDMVIDVPRSVSGSNSGVLWSTSVPPVSLLLTLPLNLPYGKIMKFGNPGMLPQPGALLPPPPPPVQHVSSSCDGLRSLCDVAGAKSSLTPRTLGAKKSYYCFSPSLHPGAHTLFSHAGGICDTFAASLHLELAILYVPPPLLATVASIFQALAPRLPRLESPLRLECGGLEERNAPGRFGGKVLTVSCAVGEEEERYKFQQMQEFLMLFQSKVEMLLREYTLQQQLLTGRKYTSNGHQRQGQGGTSVPGRRHNIWRYTMSCMPTSLACKRDLGSSPPVPQEIGASKVGSVAADVESSATGGPADAHGTPAEPATFTGSSNAGGGTGGGFLDLTIRAFEVKALDKAVKEYARKLVVKDVCVSEIRLVTTRGIEDKTCEIDPRFPQYSIGTRPIVLAPNGQLCRHSLADVHVLPDVWEVRLRPGNTRDEQKRLVERCVLACIENRPLHVRNETLKDAIDAGVILWVNGKMALLPPPPPPTTRAAQQQDTLEKQHHVDYHARQAEYTDVLYENGNQKQQVLLKHGKSRSGELGLLDSRDSTRPSTPARDAQEQVWGRAASCSSRQGVSQMCLSSRGEDFFEELLHLSKDFSSRSSLQPAKTDDIFSLAGGIQERETVNAAAAPTEHYQPVKLMEAPAFSGGLQRDYNSYNQVDAALAPLRESFEKRTESDNSHYQAQVQQQVETESNYIDSLIAAIGAIPPDLLSDKAAAWSAAMRDTVHGPLPASGKTAAQEDDAMHSTLLQAQQLLEVLAAGWTQQPQQASADIPMTLREEKHIRREAEGARERCTEVQKPICDSAVQRIAEALQCSQQLQHGVSGDRIESKTEESLISAEASLLLEQLLALPAASSNKQLTTEARDWEQLSKQHGREGVEDHMQLTCRRRSDDSRTAAANKCSAAAASASEALVTRSRSCLIDLAKLLDSADTADAVKASTLSNLATSLQGSDLLQGRRDLEETVLRGASAANATCSTRSRASIDSSESSAFFKGVTFDIGMEGKASAGNRNAISDEGPHPCGRSSLSYTCPPGAMVTSGKSMLQGNKDGVIACNTDVADAESSRKMNSGDPSFPPSAVHTIAGSNSLPEELSHRQQLLAIFCAAAGELADTNAFGGQGPAAPVSQHIRSHVVQQQEEGSRATQQQRLHQYLSQNAQQTFPEQRDDGQQTATQELLDRHAVQLPHGGSNVPSGNVFLQGFLPEDLSQQHNFNRSSCREYVSTSEKGGARNLLLQCGADEALSQQQAKTADSFFDLHVGGIKQQCNYSQVQY